MISDNPPNPERDGRGWWRIVEIGREAHKNLLNGILSIDAEHPPALAVNRRSIVAIECRDPFVSSSHSVAPLPSRYRAYGP